VGGRRRLLDAGDVWWHLAWLDFRGLGMDVSELAAWPAGAV
jgi:hypothetical protein